ncbi:MAG: Asp23/Gls24 family envelope stress response protein [Bellilinea sp.]
MNDSNQMGNIFISHRAIASIAHQAALGSYGVVGLAAKSLVDGFAQVLVKDPTLGVEVDFANDGITIDLFIVIEYGTRIKSVASSVADTVRYQVEKTLGLPVKSVNVHVRGLRISDLD